MKKTKILVLGAMLTASSAIGYMPAPADTHWDGYGSDPYNKGPTQANQLNQLGNKPKSEWNKQPIDPNFNSNQFQTSNPDYKYYGSETPEYEAKQFFSNGQYLYPNPTQWQYAPLNQPQVQVPNTTDRPQPVFQNQLVPEQPQSTQPNQTIQPNQTPPTTYKYVPQNQTYPSLPSTYQSIPAQGTPGSQ